MPSESARAKINLTLHVGRIIEDRADPFFGYHPLDSLVVFADVTDALTCKLADETSLDIFGPFGTELETGEDNLILKAYRAAARHTNCPPLNFTLEKNLPIAAGIGGGSANAAAALRLIRRHADMPEQDWQDIALKLGADVPVCFASRTARMTGIGESVTPLDGAGQLQAVLVNPGVQVLTRDVFKSLDSRGAKETPRPQKTNGDLLTRALDGRNDLEASAMAAQPVIADVLRALGSEAGCQLARMSGSGATCFGIFETRAAALKAADSITALQPNWWVQAAQLGEAR